MAYDPETPDELPAQVRRFVNERLIPNEAKAAADDKIPDDILAEMKDMGLYGLSVPQDYGGLGLSMSDEVLVAFELGRCSPAFRSAFGTNVGIGSQGGVLVGPGGEKRAK